MLIDPTMCPHHNPTRRQRAGGASEHVRLMTRVPNNRIVGRVEDSMKGDRQLNDAEIRTEMPTGRGHLLDQE